MYLFKGLLPKAIQNFLYPPPSDEEMREHAQQLENFLPLLKYKKNNSQTKLIDNFKNHYIQMEMEAVDQHLLSDALYYCLQELASYELPFIDLKEFNQLQAQELATNILESFSSNDDIFLSNWVDNFEQKLLNELLKQLSSINKRVWVFKKIYSVIPGTLSYLWRTKQLELVKDFVCKSADTHAFFQAVNFATQNDNMWLVPIDLFNYFRYANTVSNIKNILCGLFLAPFYQIVNEYKNIIKYEKNIYLKFFRTLMPLIIIAAFMIVVAAALTALSLPEIAIIVAYIPAFFIGVGLASQYIWLKDKFYTTIRALIYGGHFNIPEFQVNERMIFSLGSRENAEKVREFYIQEIKRCESLERQCRALYDKGLEVDPNKDERTENLDRRSALYLEWFDIHSHKDLPANRVAKLVLKQLRQVIDRECKTLEGNLKQEHTQLESAVKQLINDFKTSLANCIPYDTTHEIKDVPLEFSHRLFRPAHSLRTKVKAEALDELRQNVRLNESYGVLLR